MTIAHRFILAALVAFGTIVAFTSPTYAQEVDFGEAWYSVSESEYQPNVTIDLSEPATSVVRAWYSHRPGSAEFQTDYYVAEGLVMWQPGEYGPKPVDLFIIDDSEVEPTEEFYFGVTSVEGATQIGFEVTITIHDNDSTVLPGATFFNPNQPCCPSIFTAREGSSFEVGIRLSLIPEAPLQVQWQSELTTGVQSVTFDGVLEQIIFITAPPINEPGHSDSYEIEILPGEGLAPPIYTDVRVGRLLVSPGSRHGWVDTCAYCIFNYFMGHLGSGDCERQCDHPDCPDKMGQATKQLSTYEVLQRYRDEVLVSTATGQFYIDLYDELSPDLGWLVMENLNILDILPDMEATWIPAFEGLVNGHGDAYYVVGPMQAQLSQLFDALEGAATGDLAATLAFERDRLGLDAVDGMNMDELQEQLETNGGVDAPHTSWGTVKAHYGGH